MRFVQPIRDMEQVQEFMEYLDEKNKRNFIMFLLGINLGLRISDVLELRVKDVRNKAAIKIYEKKTGKYKQMIISDELRRAVKEYTKNMKPYDYLLQSRKKTKTGGQKPISRVQAYRIMKETADAIGYTGDVGTHTMRKTFAYHFYQQTNDVATLQAIFGHEHQSDTLRYIGVEQERVDQVVNNLFRRRKTKQK